MAVVRSIARDGSKAPPNEFPLPGSVCEESSERVPGEHDKIAGDLEDDLLIVGNTDLVAAIEKAVGKQHNSLQEALVHEIQSATNKCLASQASIHGCIESLTEKLCGSPKAEIRQEMSAHNHRSRHADENALMPSLTKKRLVGIVEEVDKSASLGDLNMLSTLDMLVSKKSLTISRQSLDQKGSCKDDISESDSWKRKLQSNSWDMRDKTAKLANPWEDWHETVFHSTEVDEQPFIKFMRYLGLSHMLPEQKPQNLFTNFASSPIFTTTVTLIILLNIAFFGIESHIVTQRLLSDPVEEPPGWLAPCQLGFDIFFSTELLLRIAAYRLWFIADPKYWAWNIGDTLIVIFSLVTDRLASVRISFLRALYIIRVIRVARVIRVVREFLELRKMLFAMMSSLVSLFWSILFLLVLAYAGAVFFLQFIMAELTNDENQTGRHRPDPALVENWGSLPRAMFSFILAMTEGTWNTAYQPVRDLGWVYGVLFIAYILFLNIGVLNVLTGIFVESAVNYQDRDLIVMNETEQLQSFIMQMMQLYGHKVGAEEDAKMTYTEFQDWISDQTVQAYLSYHGLDSVHAHSLFQVLDTDGTNEIDVRKFVLGLMRIKGHATNMNVMIIFHELRILRKWLYAFEERLAKQPLAASINCSPDVAE